MTYNPCEELLTQNLQEIYPRFLLSRITVDPGLRMRVKVPEQILQQYALKYRNKEQLPPVDIFAEAIGDSRIFWLAGGFIRYDAAVLAGEIDIAVKVHQGSRRDALLFACQANHEHGYPSSLADRRLVAMTLLRDKEWSDWSNGTIARICKLDEKSIRNYRARIASKPQKEPSPNIAPIVISSHFGSSEVAPPESAEGPLYQTKHGTTSRMNLANIKESQLKRAEKPPALEEVDARDPLLRSDYAHWNTPPEALELVRRVGRIALDPCSNQWSCVKASTEWCESDNGLERAWRDVVGEGLCFVNPPFGRELPKWTKKITKEKVSTILLVPSRTDTLWFHRDIVTAQAICFWKGRFHFWREGEEAKNQSTFPTMFAYWGKDAALFCEVFGSYGFCSQLSGEGR